MRQYQGYVEFEFALFSACILQPFVGCRQSITVLPLTVIVSDGLLLCRCSRLQ
jgi:hypothetical protein